MASFDLESILWFWFFFIIFLHISVCGSNKLSLKVIDISLTIEKILLIITFNLDTPQTFLCQIFWIVNVNDVVIIFFDLRLTLSFKLFLSLFLEGEQFAFIETIKVYLLRIIHLGIEIVQYPIFVAFRVLDEHFTISSSDFTW